MNNQERLLDLLAARATEGLSIAEQQEMDHLLAGQHAYSVDEFELAAAEIDVAFLGGQTDTEEMPAALRQRILAGARDHLPAKPGTVTPFPASEPEHTKGASPPWWTGWVAAAAVLLVMIVAPWKTDPVDPAVPIPTLAEMRQQLIDDSPDVLQVAWTPPEIEAYTGVTGDVVWSNRTQSGYMRLSGLPANLPSEAQYQLWIVDPARDQNPIDGGVFDIAVAGGEVIVPIDAKLDVVDPKAFAITLEQPGGVVVSAGPLLVVAPVG